MRRLRRQAGVSLAVLGVAAAFGHTAAAADGPVPVPDATALVDAALQATDPATTPDAEAVLEVVEELADVAAIPVETAAPAPAAPAGPEAAPTQEASAPAVETPAPVQEAPEAPPETPVSAAETPTEPSETPVSPLPDAVVEQVRPVNVNISLRVESPGDNGPVSQDNAALGAVTAELVTTPAAGAQSQPAAPQPAPAVQADTAPPAPAPAAPESPAATAAAPTEQWDWTWEWSCGEVISPDIVLPGTSSLPIWNWNWNWNCGEGQSAAAKSETELSSQYHPRTTQYQPINVNISIRVSSPGNDGAVSQTNIARTAVAVITAATLPVLSPLVRSTPGSSTSPASPSSPGQAPATEAAPAASLAELIIEFTAEVAAVPLELAVDLTCCTGVAPLGDIAGDDGAIGGLAEGATVGSPAKGVRFGSTAGKERRDITAAAGAIASVTPAEAETIAALAVPKPKAEAARRAETHERLTKHVKHKAAPANERFVAITYRRVTPLGAPDKDFKLLLLFLLPFVFALAAAARRVEDDDRAADAEPGRPEGRPG